MSRSEAGTVTENAGHVGKSRQIANGKVSAGAEKRVAAVQVFYPELVKVGKSLRIFIQQQS